jgi:DNA-directed RNA polymerase II subunit RPB2
MCHTGFNVEDSILINESAIERGLFKMSYYSMYETYEETGDSSKMEKRIANPVLLGATNLKPGYNYNELGENGIIREGTVLDEKTVIIGGIKYSNENPTLVSDSSIFSAKGQTGIVDKVYFSENEEGRRIVKVRVREEREPNIGDKFSSRCGQKGTIGTRIPEVDMPFTKDGLRPDLIINPHCMPSRMTINQLIECLFCKVAVTKGCAVDATPFVNQGPKHKLLGGLLNEYDLHSSGNEILYNGMTGEQIESEIYMGPTYYTRLKHMTQDKINYRARGPRAALTRQTNHGRSKDGGLRIGDMERDSILSHGMSAFMYDSMMNRGDYYKMAICNQSGTIAIYNRSTQNFYSPLADGPLQFDQVDKETFVPNLITKYGKDFSIVEVPYCLKLLMHELTTMNVQLRLITADTIDSLTTAGKRSLGDFKVWSEKELPEEPLEKTKIEKLLNQPLSEEEYQAIVDPIEAPEAPDMEEYDPKPNNNDVPMVLQPLKEDSDEDSDESMPYMPQAPMSEVPMSQPPMSQAPIPQAPMYPETVQVDESILPQKSSEEALTEEPVTKEPVKDVKKISFKK